MAPSKYNFYICSVDKSMYFLSNTYIDSSGAFIGESNKYSSGYNKLGGKCIYIDLTPGLTTNRIFFYDASKNFISYKFIAKNDSVIIPPSNAFYYAVSFYGLDENFMMKKDVKFIYLAKPAIPHYKELSKKYAKETGQEFFRVSIDGKINLFGDDFELVYNSSLEDKMIFIIDKYYRTSGKWEMYYKGEFNKTDCKFNYEKKSCELKTTAIDEYGDIINKYENTYDIIKLAPAITKINLHKRALMQVYVRGSNTITNFFGGTYWEDDVNEAIDSHDDLRNKYYFAYIGAGNEFNVEGAGIAAVNGVYAGTNGNWNQWNGYTLYAESTVAGNSSYLYIKRNSDNAILYKSESQYKCSETGNMYIQSSVRMINVDNSNDKFSVFPIVYHIYRRLLCDVDTVTDSEGTKNTYALPSNDFVADNRNYKKCIGLTGGLFFCTSRAVDEPTKYGLNDYGQYFTNKFIPTSSGLGRPLPISKNSWANASLWYVYDNYYEYFDERLRKKYTLKNNYSIADVIKALLSQIDPAIKHEATAEYSQFLYDATMPLAFVDRFYIFLTPKSNILKGDYDQPAQKAEISFEGIMKMLQDCFRCYWFIEDGKLKIEHISYFMNGGSYSNTADIQLDFTALTDQFNKKLSSFYQSEIEYDKTDLSQRYEFGWMDNATDLFGGVTIDVNSNYIQKDKTEEINANLFSSDVDFMLFNPGNFSSDGFALLCPTQANTGEYSLPIVATNLIDENGDRYSAIVQNWFASWSYLVRLYMWDMPALSINCNTLGNYLSVNSIKMCMKHTIEFFAEEDPDNFKMIKTLFGNGKIDEISVNIDTRRAKVKLLYQPK